jgi:hypothetical protein
MLAVAASIRMKPDLLLHGGRSDCAAAVLAGELGQEGNWTGFSIHVADPHGKEIARVQITLVAVAGHVRFHVNVLVCS